MQLGGGGRRLSVSEFKESAWTHALLLEVKRLTGGFAVVINSSFNTRGKPILNTAEEALTLLVESEDMDGGVSCGGRGPNPGTPWALSTYVARPDAHVCMGRKERKHWQSSCGRFYFV